MSEATATQFRTGLDTINADMKLNAKAGMESIGGHEPVRRSRQVGQRCDFLAIILVCIVGGHVLTARRLRRGSPGSGTCGSDGKQGHDRQCLCDGHRRTRATGRAFNRCVVAIA